MCAEHEIPDILHPGKYQAGMQDKDAKIYTSQDI